MRDAIHFVHGNGFPSSCYRQLLEPLQAQFDCYSLERVGHTDVFPVTDNWHHLVQEVIFSIEQQTTQPVIALGHSLGGVLSLLASMERPELFKAVVMLDSPLLGWLKSMTLKAFKYFGMVDKVTPAHRTRGRRKHWKSKEQVWSYLKNRPLFASFTDACLQDYIDFGLEQDNTGYTLRFDRHIEYQIYRTIPHILPRYEQKETRPVALIYGNKSRVVSAHDLRYLKKKHSVVCYPITGGHMFPFEHPQVTAARIIDVIHELLEQPVKQEGRV